jgi:hypothetical protein
MTKPGQSPGNADTDEVERSAGAYELWAKVPEQVRLRILAGWSHHGFTENAAAAHFDGLSSADQRHVVVAATKTTGEGIAKVAAEEQRIAAQVDREATARFYGRQIAREDLWTPTPAPWPVLDDAALYGLAGEVVAELAPHTEADSAALLLEFLSLYGVIVGREPHVIVGRDEHPARLFGVTVGETARARKGSAYSMNRAVYGAATPAFVGTQILGGFGSGEALVSAASENDHRVLVREPEFARLLTVAGRDGSTLSMYVRAAWDGVRLENRSVKGGKVAVDGAHIGVLADVSAEELRARLGAVEIANGFANRFLYVCARDSKRLPGGGQLDDESVTRLGSEVRERIEDASTIGVMHRTPAADELWVPLYHAMCEDNPGGLLGSVIARDQAQMVRLQVAYALTDASPYIERHHVEAAWAFWRYCRASAAHIFAGSLGDPIADELLEELRKVAPRALDGSEQREVVGHHATAAELHRVREMLADRGLAETWTESTGGRPRTFTRLCSVGGEEREEREERS